MFPNVPNFRDLGGYPATNGRTVRRGVIFRSDDLAALTDDEVGRLAELRLRTVVDFRSRQEVLLSPDVLPPTVAREIFIPIDAGKLINNFYGGELNRRKTMGIMISVYRQFASDFAPSFRQFFDLLADRSAAPLLFHCTAGKDRTGFAAALFLSSLGVERNIVIDDYLLSAEILGKKYIKGRDYGDVEEPLYSVFPEFLQAAFEVIDAEEGGMDGYLRNRLGVDVERMREMYTE